MRYITVIFIIISFCTLSQAAFDGSSYWPEFYPYLHCDQECIDSMINVNVRWQLNQGQNGWNKYRFGLIGNSVTNDGPFPSDLSEGTQPGGWWGSGNKRTGPSLAVRSYLSPCGKRKPERRKHGPGLHPFTECLG